MFLLLPAIFLLPISVFSNELVSLQPYYRSVTLTGFTYPRQEMTITSEVSGKCRDIFADTGDLVPPNGALATIDTTFILLDIEANSIAQEQTARQLAEEEKSLARYTTLLNQKSTPQAQLDQVNLDADLHRLTLKKLKNEAVRLKEQLTRHTLTAPQGWKVIERFAEPGELIQSGKPVAHIGDFRKLLIPLALTYSELEAISSKQHLSLYLPDLDTKVSATIYRSSPVFDATTRKIHTDLIINADQTGLKEKIRGGMRAELQFTIQEETGTFLVPNSALVNRYEASWLTNAQNTPIQVIFIGKTGDGQFSIISGKSLKAGQKVQLNPAPFQ